MTLYYLEELIESNREPDVLIDPNVDVGAGKLMSILEMASTAQIETIVDAVFQDRPIQMVQGNLGEPINLARRKHLTESEIVAVLFYMGFLTRSSHGDGFFVCPNQAMKANFARIFFKRRGLAFSPNWAFVRQCLERLAKGDEKALFQYVADQFASDAGVHFSANLSEKIFHTALYTYVKLSPDFEPFVEKEAGGFVDLLLLTTEHSASEYSYVVELKYLSHEQAKKAGEIGKKLNDAKEQLIRYARSKNLDVLRHKPYRFLRVLYVGVKLEVCEDVTDRVLSTLKSEKANGPQGCATS